MPADNSKQPPQNTPSTEPSSTPVRDAIFTEPEAGSADFRFDKKTASVFDDMVSRSVPFYHEMQRMTGELSAEFAVDGTNLCDLGCATGTTLIHLDPLIRDGVHFVGVDNSAEMLSKAQEKLQEHGVHRPCKFINADLHRDRVVENASVVIMLLTLQFIRPLYRERVIQQIYEGLNEQGCLIVIEKLTVQDSLFNRLFINFYYEMKRRNGYSEVEISQKREALENVLIPYRPEENHELLRGTGFRYVEEFFRWYNFCGMVAVK